MKVLRLPILGIEVTVKSDIHVEKLECQSHNSIKRHIFKKHGVHSDSYKNHSSCHHGSLSVIESRGACWFYLNHKPKLLTKLSSAADIAAKAHKEAHLLHRLGRIDLLENSIEKTLGYRIDLSRKSMTECQSAGIGSLYALYIHNKFSKTNLWLFKTIDKELFDFASRYFPLTELLNELKWLEEKKTHLFG